MINLTSTYPNVVFLPLGATQLIAQVNTINNSGIINKDFPKKFRRSNTGFAPNGSGAATSQIDVLINPNPQYAFQNLQTAQSYAQQGANQMVNNPSFFVENIQPTYYQMVVWGTV